jgi:hypothetical protein
MSAVISVPRDAHVAALMTAYARLTDHAPRSRVFDGDEPESRLGALVHTFSLSSLERDILLFAAAAEMAPELVDARTLVEQATDDAGPTVQSIYDRCSAAEGNGLDWLAFRTALREDSPLLHWRLVSLSGGDDPLPSRALDIDPRVVDFLLGGTLAGEDVCRVASWRSAAGPAQVDERSAPAAAAVLQAVELIAREPGSGRRLFVSVRGGSADEIESFAQGVLRAVGMPLLSTTAGISPRDRMLVLRESLLAHAGVLVHGLPPAIESDDARDWYRRLVQASPIVFLAQPPEEGLAPIGRPRALDGHAWMNVLLPPSRRPVPHRLRELSQRIASAATWDDLILPPEIKRRLEDVCDQSRLQQTVLVDGGFGRRLTRGRGVTALLCGPSGTGKTLAAEVISNHLDRELYRVDLARVVSKYIGDTEKNLREIFAEAERARCVLFFDEADALFGKRTEVRDSHDRYANLEVSYLLQLFEDAEGALILLATNRRDAIDDAFARRFRFVVDFPMPDAELRAALWRSSFSPEMPLDLSVRVEVLADRLPLSGASIRNIALASAFLAASQNAGSPSAITAPHIVTAALRELEKLSSPMPLTATDITATGGAPKAGRRR